MRKALLYAALALTLAACAALPTPVPRSIGGLLASPTKTARPRPSRTPPPPTTPTQAETPTTFPSETSEPVQSLTPAFPFPLPSATPALPFLVLSPTPPRPTPSALDCKLIWQSPHNGAIFDTGQKFSAGWKIRNIGTVPWVPGSFQFTYLGGAKLATHDYLIPLQANVAPGGEVVLSVPMKAPSNPNKYTTHWGIRQGDVFFCRLTLTIWASD